MADPAASASSLQKVSLSESSSTTNITNEMAGPPDQSVGPTSIGALNQRPRPGTPNILLPRCPSQLSQDTARQTRSEESTARKSLDSPGDTSSTGSSYQMESHTLTITVTIAEAIPKGEHAASMGLGLGESVLVYNVNQVYIPLLSFRILFSLGLNPGRVKPMTYKLIPMSPAPSQALGIIRTGQ